MKKFIVFVSAVCLLFGTTLADSSFSAPSMHRTAYATLVNGASPSSATTTAQTAVTGMDSYAYCWIYSKIQGATGGTLDVYIQTSFDGGTTWVDLGHYTQLAAAAGLSATVVAISKWGPTVNTAPTSVPTTVNSTSGTPSLAANTFLSGVFGNAFRAVFVAGSGTSAGATQVISMFCSSS